jgi:hypothetical protein
MDPDPKVGCSCLKVSFGPASFWELRATLIIRICLLILVLLGEGFIVVILGHLGVVKSRNDGGFWGLLQCLDPELLRSTWSESIFE